LCAEGYDGAACQRASCPGYPSSCSGHGVCKSIQQLAKADYGNIYELWDKKTTMGCECDSGFSGPDCSLKMCKQGIDPLYLDDAATVKYSVYNFAILHSNIDTTNVVEFTNGMFPIGPGHWAVRFYDMSGEDWLTMPIVAGASCDEIESALYDLPNNVIPVGSLECTMLSLLDVGDSTWPALDFINDTMPVSYKDTFPDDRLGGSGAHHEKINIKASFWDKKPVGKYEENFIQTIHDATEGAPSSYSNSQESFTYQGYIYRIKFFGNPGKLRQPEIETFLDGKRSALTAAVISAPSGTSDFVVTRVWTDGQQGESVDHVADHCDGISVTVQPGSIHQQVANYGTDFQTGQVTFESNAIRNATLLDMYSYLMGPWDNELRSYLPLTDDQIGTLKACLGGSDPVEENNIEVYNWDAGSAAYPHLIKLVRTVSTTTGGGYFVALYFVPPAYTAGGVVQPGTNIFKLLNPFIPLDVTNGENDLFDIYTTTGVLARTTGTWSSASAPGQSQSEALFGFAANEIYTTPRNFLNETEPQNLYAGSVSCEYKMRNTVSDMTLPHCLNKTDLFLLFQFDKPALNSPHLNIHTAEKLYTKRFEYSYEDYGLAGLGVDEKMYTTFLTDVIISDISTNWGSAPRGMAVAADNVVTPTIFDPLLHPYFDVYKFIPNVKSSYEYVAECSNRGICDTQSGLCTCFAGYTSDTCGIQNSLAV
jgi:EGF-like domain